jgi:ribosome-associated heat shock protein Hsp15
MSEAGDAQRVDIWLYRTRLFKTRALAAALATKGRIRVSHGDQTRRLSKASAPVREGDTLTLPKNGRVMRIKVLGLGLRRGPADEARTLFELVDDENSVDVTTHRDRPRGH